MAYDKDKRNLRQRAGRFLKKYGIELSADDYQGYVVKLNNEHANILWGGSPKDKQEYLVPLGENPVDAILAMQGVSLLIICKIPGHEKLLLDILEISAIGEPKFKKQAASMLQAIGSAKGWLTENYAKVGCSEEGAPMPFAFWDVLDLLMMHQTADATEIVEQYMYLR